MSGRLLEESDFVNTLLWQSKRLLYIQYVSGPEVRFFAARFYSSREIRGIVIRHSRLERKTA